MDQFDRVAEVYARFRPTYPDEVYARIMARNGGRPFRDGVDIGCGAGHSTYGLASICQNVTGIEPFDNLRDQAARVFPDYQFKAGQGEATGLADKCVDVATIATAFYWMDRKRAIMEIHRILRPNGQLAFYRYRFPVVEAVSNHVVQSHLHRFWDQHRDERLTRDDDSDQLLHASGCFRDIELLKVRNVLELTVDEFVGFLESTSYVSRYIETLGGLEQERYCADFRDELHAAHGSDRINVNFDIHMIMAEAV